jgi:succinate dehydrogenase / fumarate reductase, cytochrome b subunit
MQKEHENVHNTRPKNLNLFTIRFPIPAIISILHRISGFFLFLFIPIALWALSFSLTEPGFEQLHQWLSTIYVKIIFWLLLIPFCFHLVAGIRHLLSDVQIGITLKGGRMSAILTFVISILLILLAGIWLW